MRDQPLWPKAVGGEVAASRMQWRPNFSGRHVFAARLPMAGVDLRTIQALGGGRSLKMVERYAHLSPGHKAEAVERLASNFPTGFTTPTRVGVAGAV